MTEVVAALDCGSNSTRLLIENAKGQVLRRELRITRLSQGVDASGTLEDEALARSYRVLAEYRRFMDEAGVERGLHGCNGAHDGVEIVADQRGQEAGRAEPAVHRADPADGLQ